MKILKNTLTAFLASLTLAGALCAVSGADTYVPVNSPLLIDAGPLTMPHCSAEMDRTMQCR